MKKVIQVSICCFWLIFLGCNSEQKEVTKEVVKKEYKHFLSIEDVKARIEAKESIRIIEISKSAQYQEKHLPNAIHLWRPDYENSTDYDYGGMAASKLQMEQMLGNKGISSNDTIVLYDTKGSCDAIRLLWILTMYGHENAYIMDGGKVAWEQAGFPFTETIPKFDTIAYEFRDAIQNDNYATIEDVKAAIRDTNVVLLDTRELYEFKGEPYLSKSKIMPYKKGAFTYGCISTAVHLNWSDAVDLDGDHCIKSVKDLRYNFEQAGITPDKEIIAYCQSGVRSMHTTYVLTEILGYPKVKNYDGSWIEWSYFHTQDQSVEVERHTSVEHYEQLTVALGEKLEQEKSKVLQ